MAIHEMPMWATKAQAEEILEKLNKVKIVVTVETQDGVSAAGQVVYIHNGKTEKDPVCASIRYDGEPVTLMVDKGIEYFVRVSNDLEGHFNPSTAYGFADTDKHHTLVYSDIHTVNTFADISGALKVIGEVEEAKRLFLGKEFEDTYTRFDGVQYSNPMVVVDAREYEDGDGCKHLGLVLQRKYASYNDIVFDAPEHEVATEETAIDGLYYYGWTVPEYDASKTYNSGVRAKFNGKIYSARVKISTPEPWNTEHWTETTIPNDIAQLSWISLLAGDTVPYDSYDMIFHNAVKDTTKNILVNGYNRWKDSAFRQYLNSDKNAGEWWEPQHEGDSQPSSATAYRGYLAGCSAALLAAIKPVKTTTWANTTTDGGVKDYTIDKFFLPSGIEMFGEVNRDGTTEVEGLLSPYWKEVTGYESPNNAAKPTRIQYRENNHSSASVVWLRSPYRGTSYRVWLVYTSGQLNNYDSAYSAYACVPACVIY